MTLIGVLGLRLWRKLIRVSPQIAGGWLHFDHVGAEVRQDHGGAWTRDEAREVHHLEPREDIFRCHDRLLNQCGTHAAEGARTTDSRFSSTLIFRGSAARAFPERRPCPRSCLRSRRKGRSRTLPAATRRLGSSPCPCSPPRARI